MDEGTSVKKYFAPFPKWALALIVIGVICLFTGSAFPIIIGLILLGSGIFVIVNWTKRPSDQEIDSVIDKLLKKVRSEALKKSGMDESEIVGEPVLITGPQFWDIAGAEVHWKKGNDGILRFTPMNSTVINFTPNQLLSFQCVLDLITGNTLNQSTDEFFYKDVVSVSTKTISKTIQLKDGPVQMNDAETFSLTTSGGTDIKVILRDRQLIEKMGGGDIPITNAEKAIQTVRKMLREKKV